MSSGGPVGARSAFVVLAGGDSRRMGRDKAFLRVGSREMLDGLLGVGRSVCTRCVVVADDPPRYADALERYGWEEVSAPPSGADGGRPAPGEPAAGTTARPPPGRRFRREDAGLRLTTDRRPGRGPLAGLEAGLGAARRPLCFVAACDLPFLSEEVVASVLRALDEGTADPRAVVPTAAGRSQPLAAGYTSSAARVARRCLDEGERRTDDLLDRLAVRTVAAHELLGGARDAARRAFTNVNRPADLRRARRAAGASDAGARAPGAGGRSPDPAEPPSTSDGAP